MDGEPCGGSTAVWVPPRVRPVAARAYQCREHQVIARRPACASHPSALIALVRQSFSGTIDTKRQSDMLTRVPYKALYAADEHLLHGQAESYPWKAEQGWVSGRGSTARGLTQKLTGDPTVGPRLDVVRVDGKVIPTVERRLDDIGHVAWTRVSGSRGAASERR